MRGDFNVRYNKIIDIKDYSTGVLSPHLRELAMDEAAAFGLTEPEIIPDSKQWECAMMLRTFADHGLIKPGAKFVGLGAGSEQTTFVLAGHGCVVFPTDRYLEVTPWSDVAPAGMMAAPSAFSRIDHDARNVIPVHTDARAVRLPSDFFDGVYSAGSIEHFGSITAVEAAAEEMGRLLRPGGVASISTEFRLDGPNDRKWFDDNCILFTPELLQRHIIEPSGLELIDEPDFSTSDATFDSRVVLLDFLTKTKGMKTIEDKRNAYPNLVLFHEGFLFCSVHLALRKPETETRRSFSRSAVFKSEIRRQSERTAGVLAQQLVSWNDLFDGGEVASRRELDALAETARSIREERDQLASLCISQEDELRRLGNRVAELEKERETWLGSYSFRLSAPVRALGAIVRRNRVIRHLATMVAKVAGVRRPGY